MERLVQAKSGFLLIGLLFLLLLPGSFGCSSPAKSPPRKGGVFHEVRPGETVWRISRRYGVTVEDVVQANGIEDVTEVRAGTRLWIPLDRKGRTRKREVQSQTAGRTERTESAARANALKEAGLQFQWPVQGKISSKFGPRNGSTHEGLDVSAPKGTKIFASESGRVIYSDDDLGDYGKVIIIKHAGRYSSVYAHNRRNLVKKGSFVEKGQLIATVGKSGNATGYHLHFEIRRDRKPQDPLLFLP